MTTAMLLTIFQLAFTVILGVLGYRISRQNIHNSWLQTLAAINDKFWNDDDIHLIRRSVTYSQAYQPLKIILEKRKALHDKSPHTSELEENEYILLDKLDKFLHLLERAVISNREYRKHRNLWNALFFDYWLERSMEKEVLSWYINTFYPTLSKLYKTRGYLKKDSDSYKLRELQGVISIGPA
jgi:hypothetical protein